MFDDPAFQIILLSFASVPVVFGILLVPLWLEHSSRPLRGGVEGTAQVVGVSRNNGRATYQTCRMDLVIQGRGIPPTAVSYKGPVRTKLWPMPGQVLPVSIDPTSPQKFHILWGKVPENNATSLAAAESIAAAMRGETSAGLPAPFGDEQGFDSVQVVGDISQLTDTQRAKLRRLGINLDTLVTQAGTSSGADAVAAPGTDTISQLERLSAQKTKESLPPLNSLTRKEKSWTKIDEKS